MSIIRLETPSQRACEPCTNGLHIQKFSLHVISNTRYIGIAEGRPQNIFYEPLILLLDFFKTYYDCFAVFFHSQRVRKIPLKISSWWLDCLIWRVNFTRIFFVIFFFNVNNICENKCNFLIVFLIEDVCKTCWKELRIVKPNIMNFLFCHLILKLSIFSK